MLITYVLVVDGWMDHSEPYPPLSLFIRFWLKQICFVFMQQLSLYTFTNSFVFLVEKRHTPEQKPKGSNKLFHKYWIS